MRFFITLFSLRNEDGLGFTIFEQLGQGGSFLKKDFQRGLRFWRKYYDLTLRDCDKANTLMYEYLRDVDPIADLITDSLKDEIDKFANAGFYCEFSPYGITPPNVL